MTIIMETGKAFIVWQVNRENSNEVIFFTRVN